MDPRLHHAVAGSGRVWAVIVAVMTAQTAVREFRNHELCSISLSGIASAIYWVATIFARHGILPVVLIDRIGLRTLHPFADLSNP
jgi:hypothetical protein